MPLSDYELIELAKQGSDSSFEELIYRYDETVLSIALKFVQDRDDAKDIYQEVFIRVYKGLKNFQFKSGFSTWLYRITVNVCLSYKNKITNQPRVSINNNYDDLDIEKRNDELIYKGISPEEEAVSTELGEFINSAVESLSSKQKMTFILKHYRGYKIREIAEMLDCKEGTVKKYLFDAIKNLRKKLHPVYTVRKY